MQKYLDMLREELQKVDYDAEGIRLLAAFLADTRNTTLLRHNDTDGLLFGYLAQPFVSKVIEFDYSVGNKTIIDVLKEEIINGDNPKILIGDIALDQSLMGQMLELLELAKIAEVEILWVDHHDDTRLLESYLTSNPVNHVSVYHTKHKISACKQMYAGIQQLTYNILERSLKLSFNIDIDKLRTREANRKELIQCGSDYDTFSNINSKSIRTNDILICVKQMFPNDHEAMTYAMYDNIVKNGMGSKLAPIAKLLEQKAAERDALYSRLKANEPAEHDEFIVYYMGTLPELESRLMSVVANIFLQKRQPEETKDIVIVWTSLIKGANKCSLRSLTDRALKIARLFEGGGHEQSAGCTCTKEVLDYLL